MALKLNLKHITNDHIEDAKAAGGYSGPTPPPSRYNVKVKKLWHSTTKAGDSQIVALVQWDNEGENKAYNGYTAFYRLSIPDDPSHQYYALRLRSIDDFFNSASGGKMSISEFVDCANAGKIQVEKKDKVGEPITQIGKFKIENAQDITIQSKIGEYNGVERAEVHYVDARGTLSKKAQFAEDDDDFDNDDFDEDLDDMFGDLDD